MNCPRCQATNPQGNRFCQDCGARLELACPQCGQPVTSAQKFCGGCGSALAGRAPERPLRPEAYTPKHLAEKILTSKAAIEGERKQVTVLFADLKGSLELMADRDPEEARRLLDPVLERLMEAVHRYEGTVNQVMGDGIMALFGAPLAHEDHAIRASYAALRMQQTVGWYAEELRRTQGVDVQIRVGLNSGEVVVRSIGSDLQMDYTAVGQTTHLAARMEQLARPGASLVTGQTLRLAEGYVEVTPLGPVPVKGLSEPVEVFELVRAGPVRSRLQASAVRGLTPFVGRDDEVARLRAALERAGEGRGQVVAVSGQAGVGKSRLFWEFLHSHRTHGWLILEGDAVSYGRMTSYLPMVDLLKQYFQIAERDDVRKIREKVTGKLLTLDESLRPTLPAFLTLLDVPVDDPEWQAPDPMARRQKILEAVKHLLLRESRVQPVVVMVENLHWVDSETQAFLDSLVDGLQAARMMLLVNYRPEYTHGWVSRGYYAQLRIEPLPPESAEQLLSNLLGKDPSLDPVKRLLVERTHGNPFFLEESVRTLVESQVLAGDRGAYRLARPLTALQMPATVQAVLAARIDRLSVGDKRLLQAASVVGKDVPFALLQAVGEVDEEALRQCLARLQAGEFLFESGIFPDLEYSFAHALTHEVAYGSLLSDRRTQLHREILAAIERLYADRRAEQVDVLGEHAFRGEVWGKAVQYLREAAAKASARSALQDTVSAYERALTALARLPETRENTELGIDIKLDLRPALLQMGQLPRVLALSQQAENTARLIKDDRRLARVYTYLVNYHYLKGEPEQVIAYGERCVAIGEAVGDPALQTLARGYMGYSYHAQGRYQDAQTVLRANADVPPPDPSRVEAVLPFVSSSGWLAFTLAELGDFETALTYADRARRLADESRHAYSQAIASSLAGLVWIIRGQLDRALPLLQRSLDLCRDKRLTVWEPIPCSLLGITLARLHRIEEGLPLLEEGVARSEELGVRALLALWTNQLGEGYLIAGDTARAQEMSERALDLALAHKERGHQARALRQLGDLARRATPPDLARAERDYAQAIELAQELGMRPLVGRCHLAIGHMHLEAGDRARAEQHLFAAMATFRELEIQHWLDQVLTTLSQLGHLFVVANYNVDLYEFLKEKFAADPRVRVILDRRKGERRRTGATPGSERRRSDRRRMPVPARPMGERGVMVLAVAQSEAKGTAAV